MQCTYSLPLSTVVLKPPSLLLSSAPSFVIIEDLHQLCPHQDLGPSEVDRQLTAGLVWWLEALHCLPTEKMVIVVATTSAVEKVDVTLRRPGRFDKEIEVPVPTATHRIAVSGGIHRPKRLTCAGHNNHCSETLLMCTYVQYAPTIHRYCIQNSPSCARV